ncbi:hypothetical protein HDV03_001871 [Kappamyces sp. JEL0829]|nr:hypothetical protein HDV03_001871 [Kappamyces sp. JEL0829]
MTSKDTTGKPWTSFLPNTLSLAEFEPALAKHSSDGFRISLDDNLTLVSCNLCSKKLLQSALLKHSETCTGPVKEEKLSPLLAKPDSIPASTFSPSTTGPVTVTLPNLSAAALPSAQAPNKKPAAIKKRKIDSIAPTFNYDVQCAVKTDTGKCTRAITCKMHSVSMKRAVLGRSKPYDVLFQEYQLKSNLAKKGVSAVDAPIEVIPEVDIPKLLQVIKTNKPRSFSSPSPFSIALLVAKRNRGAMQEIFKEFS